MSDKNTRIGAPPARQNHLNMLPSEAEALLRTFAVDHGEKPFRGKDFVQHERAFKRGQEWIANFEDSSSNASAQTLGNSGNSIVPFQRRSNA